MYDYTRYASDHINSYTVQPALDGIQMGLTIISFPTGVRSTKVHASDDKYYFFFVLPIPCIFLQLIHKKTHALNKMYFMTSINPLHVSVPGCHPKAAI